MKPILFAIESYQYLAEELLKSDNFEQGNLKQQVFSDGELYQRVESNVDGRKVILIGGTYNDRATLELYDLASALVNQGADSLSLIIPYFGYSTMERAVKEGEVVTAKSRARLLSSIPRSNKGNKIYLFDLHTEGLPHYFEGSLRPWAPRPVDPAVQFGEVRARVGPGPDRPRQPTARHPD